MRLAMQRSGRLSDASFELLSKCGLHIARSRTELFCRVQELPIDLLLVRDDDIPGFVEEGVCDLGIVGENVLQEQKRAAEAADADRYRAAARLRPLQARPGGAGADGLRDLADLAGRKIATSYPASLGALLAAAKVRPRSSS